MCRNSRTLWCPSRVTPPVSSVKEAKREGSKGDSPCWFITQGELDRVPPYRYHLSGSQEGSEPPAVNNYKIFRKGSEPPEDPPLRSLWERCVGTDSSPDRVSYPDTEIRVQQVNTLWVLATQADGLDLSDRILPSAQEALAALPELRTCHTRRRSPRIFAPTTRTVPAYLPFLLGSRYFPMPQKFCHVPGFLRARETCLSLQYNLWDGRPHI